MLIEGRSHITPACFARLLCFSAVRPSVPGRGFWILFGSELFRLIAGNLRERGFGGRHVRRWLIFDVCRSSLLMYNASDRCRSSAPPAPRLLLHLSLISPCTAHWCSLVLTMPPSLSTIPTSTLYEILRPILSTRYIKFYNWSKTFSCSPLIAFEPSNIEECLFALAHRECRTVRVVGASLSPSDVGRTTDFMIHTHRLNMVRVVRDISTLRSFIHMSPGRR